MYISRNSATGSHVVHLKKNLNGTFKKGGQKMSERISAERLAELRKIAGKATPGPWELMGGGEYVTNVSVMVAPDDGGVSPSNAEHIAAFDPPTVLALLDRIAELEVRLELAESNRRLAVERADDAWDVIKSDHWRERADVAEAKLAKVRELHRPVEIEPSDTICGECSMLLPNGRYFGKVEEWPCPTVAILDGEVT